MNSQMAFAWACVALLGVAFLWARRRYSRRLAEKDRALNDLSAQLVQQKQKSVSAKTELNAILSSMVEGVMVVGADEKIAYVSPNLSHMFQMRSKDVALKRYWEVIPHQQITASIKEALASQRTVSKEITLIGPEDIFFNMQVSPVMQEGRLTSAVAVFHDITELKKLLRMRSEFVANVSHELKTPLTSIKGFVETMLEDGGLDSKEDAGRFLGIIHKQTKRLEMLVEDLLTLSSIESKEAKMDFAAQDIGPIIQSIAQMHRKAVEAAGHQLTLEVPADLPNIYADRHRIEQVIINLLDNAVKFTPPGGRVVVRARVQAPYVCMEVEDTGIGISAEHVTRIFERFYRVDKARSIQSGGTGLGLSIVKHIVQSHHGKVEIHSQPGKGTIFSVFLPLIK